MNYWIIFAACFTFISCIIAFHTIWKHLKNYKKPYLQRTKFIIGSFNDHVRLGLIVRILLMPVLYAICSFLSLEYRWAEYILDPIRDCYEAFVIWMFFQLLINYMGGEGALLENLDNGRLPTRHPFPMSLVFKPVDFSELSKFLILKRAILQFVIVKPVQTLIVGILRIVDANTDGYISAHSGFLYVNLSYNISVMICMYGLVMFYMTTRYDLADRKPVPKFLCIKAVIFFSFWQMLVLNILYQVDVLKIDPSKAQDFLTCFEMMLASIAHSYAFSYEEFDLIESARLRWPDALRDVLGTTDLRMEIEHTWRGTHFRLHNDLLTDGTNTPLLMPNQHVGLKTELNFADIDPDDADETSYADAKIIGQDHKYNVVSPN